MGYGLSWLGRPADSFPVSFPYVQIMFTIHFSHYRSGDVKDFVKKIKQEDARMDMRKRNLARAAERIAQAKAKAAAAAKVEEDAVTTKILELSTPVPADATLPVSRLINTPASPLHPSLPPKPGSSPSKSLPSQDVVMKDATTVATPLPSIEMVAATPPASSQAPPAHSEPTKPPVDEQLLKLEEVRKALRKS